MVMACLWRLVSPEGCPGTIRDVNDVKTYTKEPGRAGNPRKAWRYLTKNSPWGIKPKELFFSPMCHDHPRCWVADYGDATSYDTYGACTVPRSYHVSSKHLKLYVNDDGTIDKEAETIAEEEKSKAREEIKGKPYFEARMILAAAGERAEGRILEMK